MAGDTEMTMVCMKEDGSFTSHALVIGHSTVLLTMIIIVGFLIFFQRKLQYFLIKERAPLLALAQTCIFLLTLLVPYGVELAGLAGYTWREVTVIRRVVKALYIVSRQSAYLVFTLRYEDPKQSPSCLLQLEDQPFGKEEEQILEVLGK